MKFDCDKRHNRKQEWHRWFAWYPVRLGPGDCRWLEVVERIGTYYAGVYDCGWSFTYRAAN